ncbi:hypothetical protein QCN27_03915 [Cereibacter sp. SYSU M97828]|nr:hypothetical protein [Cereibacter flavus]
MAEKKVSVRLVAEGGQQVRAEFAGMGRDGQQAFQKIDAGQKTAAASAQVFAAALDAEEAQFRQLRASLDPAYASMQRYEDVQQRVTMAVRAGITTQAEANRILAMAQTRYLSAGADGMARYGQAATNASFQVQDFAVQVASGQSAMMAFAQQAPQLMGAFGMTGKIALYGSLIGTAIALTAAIAPVFFKAGEEAKSAEDKISDLGDAVDTFSDISARAGAPIDELIDKYGSLAAQARDALEAQREYQQGIAMDALRTALTPSIGDSRFDVTNDLKLIEGDGIRAAQALDRLRIQFELNDDQARSLSDAFALVQSSTGIADQTRAASELAGLLLEIYGTADAMPEAFQQVYNQINEAVPKGAEFAATIEKTEWTLWKIVDAASNIPGWFTDADGAAQGLLGTVTDAARKMWEMARAKAAIEGDAAGNETPFGPGSRARSPAQRPSFEATERWELGPVATNRGRGGKSESERAADRIQQQRERAIQSLYQSTRTPEETYRETVAELNDLLNEGFFTEAVGGAETYERAMQAAKKTMDDAARSSNKMGETIAQDFRNMVIDAKNAGDHLVNMVTGIFTQVLNNMMAGPTRVLGDAASQFITGLLPGFSIGGGPAVNTPTSAVGTGAIYDGGGYTGNRPRTGGLDGRGGFWAVMHPQERIYDESKGQKAAPAASRFIVEAAPNPYFDVRVRELSTAGDIRAARIQQRYAPAQNADSMRRGLSGR